jgi:thiol-disulfide isomerase/thioredoxin
MKNNIFLLLLLPCLLLTACNKKETTITIQVTAQSEATLPLVYAPPIDGFCSELFLDTLIPGLTPKLTFTLEKPAFIHFRPGTKTGYKFLLEPGNHYTLTIDHQPEESHLILSGPNEKGHALYKTLPTPFFVELEGRPFIQDTPLTELAGKIAQARQKDLEPFKKLLEDREITPTYYHWIEKDRECYYASLEMICAYIKRHDNTSLPEILDHIQKIYDRYPPNDSERTFSLFWREYATKYITHYTHTSLLEQGLLTDEKQQELSAGNEFKTFHFQEAQKRLTGKNLEFYKATELAYQSFQSNDQKELIHLFNQYQKDYPNSPFTQYITPGIHQIIHFYRIAEADYSPAVRFVPQYEHLNTLQEALAPFKGKKVYIDVWASWCHPCKREFEHNPAFKPLLQENNIQMLYISIDDEKREQTWKNTIKYYNLEGSHIQANQTLLTDLRRLFNNGNKQGSLYIPWYILVDENGHITATHAESPSTILQNSNYFHTPPH